MAFTITWEWHLGGKHVNNDIAKYGVRGILRVAAPEREKRMGGSGEVGHPGLILGLGLHGNVL